MYSLFIANKNTKKKLRDYISRREDIPIKLNRLKLNPRRELGAHLLHGRLKGKWSYWWGG